MSTDPQRSMIRWWAVILAGAAAALLFTWLGRVAGVPVSVVLTVGAGAVALAWRDGRGVSRGSSLGGRSVPWGD